MSRTLSFLESPEAILVFRQLFMRLYGLAKPEIALHRVMHWNRRFGIESDVIDHLTTRFMEGYFYNFSTPGSIGCELEAEIANGEADGVHQFLIPTVRKGDGDERLSDAGFAAIPWFIESIYERVESVDLDLKKQLSRSQYRDIFRLERKAAVEFELAFYEYSDIIKDASIIKVAADLHQLNIDKYAHAYNFYNEEILNVILSSSIGKHLLICIRRDRVSKQPVQASINFIDRERSQLFQMVQGIDHALVTKGHNLYIAETVQMFRYAESQGIKEIHLGRGGHESKKRLGANRFYLLNNWIMNTKRDISAEIDRLREASCQQLILNDVEHLELR